jgi:DmsE family decaheme c-type cytochrome
LGKREGAGVTAITIGSSFITLRLSSIIIVGLFAIPCIAEPANAYPGFAETDGAQEERLEEIQNYLAGAFGVAEDRVPAREMSAPAGETILAAAEPLVLAPEAPQANYLGQQICSGCHQLETQNWAHTIHAGIFNLNPQNELQSRGCEACHGPASRHIQNPSAPGSIIRFTHGGETPVALQNGQCQACHRGGQRIFWPGSVHESSDLACGDCHNAQASFSFRGLTARQSTNETCFQCHETMRAQFSRRSHKPLLEGQMSCVDCHNPHGSTTEPLLKANSVNETCYACHAEKRGPFLFEHAPVRDSCLTCHAPHGSNHESLLVTAGPLLCQQCHLQSGHPPALLTRGNLTGGPSPSVALIGRNCANCHSQVHGSNSPAGARFMR